MMLRSLLLVLAIAAVLCGAPPPASAAGTRAAPTSAPSSNAAPDSGPLPSELTIGPVAVGIGMVGIIAMALFALLVPSAVRRRRNDAGSADAPDEQSAHATTTEEKVTAALHRRTLRRARVRLEEDPIIASMGVGSPSRAEPGIRRARRSARRSPPN